MLCHFLQGIAAVDWGKWSKELDPKLVSKFKAAYESKSKCPSSKISSAPQGFCSLLCSPLELLNMSC